MKNITQKFTKYLTFLSIAILFGITSVYASGTLTPSGTAGDDTFYSLKDVHAKLLNFTASPIATSSPFTVPGSVSATFPTLTEIYDLLTAEDANIVPEKILTGTTIFGVEGTVATGTPELEWSTEQGSMNWASAVATCAALTEGGATAGDWRLSDISELLVAISDDWITNTGPDLFESGVDYWSNYESGPTGAWVAFWVGNPGGTDLSKTFSARVRCVR